MEEEQRLDESRVSTLPEGVFMAGISSSPAHSAGVAPKTTFWKSRLILSISSTLQSLHHRLFRAKFWWQATNKTLRNRIQATVSYNSKTSVARVRWFFPFNKRAAQNTAKTHRGRHFIYFFCEGFVVFKTTTREIRPSLRAPKKLFRASLNTY